MGQEGVTASRLGLRLATADGCGRRDGDAKSRLGFVQGGSIRGTAVKIAARIAMLSAALALGACSYLPDADSFKAPTASSFFRPLSVTSFKEKSLPPVTAEDLVDANGRCAGAFVAAEPSADPAAAGQTAGQTSVPLQEAGVPMIPAAVALEMSECDVVKRAGLAERVEIGSNQGGERTATLTYLQGARPGIYHFTAGRLKLMERAPEPPPQPKPVKRAPKPKRAETR